MTRSPRAARTTSRPTARGVAALAALALGAAAVALPGGAGAGAARADLGVVQLHAPGAADPGDRAGAVVRLRNDGGAGAPASTVVVRLSRDGVVSGDDVEVGSTTVRALGAGEAVTAQVPFRVPADASRSYVVLACVDATRRVAEADEGDNCRATEHRMTTVRTLDGRLTGTLRLADSGTSEGGDGSTTTWQRDLEVDVDAEVVAYGDDPLLRDLRSTYVLTGHTTTTLPDAECPRREVRAVEGDGRFEVRRDPQSDGLYGMPLDHRLRTLYVGLVTYLDRATVVDDCGSLSVDQGQVRDGGQVVLRRVSSTADRAVYRVVEVDHYEGQTAWTGAEGRLVLRLR